MFSFQWSSNTPGGGVRSLGFHVVFSPASAYQSDFVFYSFGCVHVYVLSKPGKDLSKETSVPLWTTSQKVMCTLTPHWRSFVFDEQTGSTEKRSKWLRTQAVSAPRTGTTSFSELNKQGKHLFSKQDRIKQKKKKQNNGLCGSWSDGWMTKGYAL